MSDNKEIVRAIDYRTLKFQILNANEMYEKGETTCDEHEFLLLELEKDWRLLQKANKKKFNRSLVNKLLGFDTDD